MVKLRMKGKADEKPAPKAEVQAPAEKPLKKGKKRR